MAMAMVAWCFEGCDGIFPHNGCAMTKGCRWFTFKKLFFSLPPVEGARRRNGS
jgi:hypothetical protein